MTASALARRGAALLAAATGVALTLAACSSTEPDPGETASESSDAESVFPATVETVYGEITVTEKPEKIVVFAVVLADVLAALGQPAVFGDGYQDEDLVLASYPWMEGLYADYDPTLVGVDWIPVAEAVAAQDPDLIVSWGGGSISEDVYERLSQIAPVYEPVVTEDSGWRQYTTELGLLTGTSDEAEQVVADVDAELADAAARLPGLAGATFSGAYYQSASNDLRLPTTYGWVADLGLTLADNQPRFGEEQAIISMENLAELSGDVATISYYSDEDRERLESDPRFADLPSVQNGTFIWADDALSRAFTSSGPSGVLWGVEQVLPQLEESALNQAAR